MDINEIYSKIKKEKESASLTVKYDKFLKDLKQQLLFDVKKKTTKLTEIHSETIYLKSSVTHTQLGEKHTISIIPIYKRITTDFSELTEKIGDVPCTKEFKEAYMELNKSKVR